MQKPSKRKQLELQANQLESATKPAKLATGIKGVTKNPYPFHLRPTPDDCRAVRDDLLALHGFPQEFAEYRRQRQTNGLHPDENASCIDSGDAIDASKSEPLDGNDPGGGYDANESVLDGLVRTVLSQNTTEVNSQRAFASLKSSFHTWDDVMEADSKCIENTIRCGGLAPTKASCIKNIMRCLLEKNGKLYLEYLRDLSVDEVKAELSQFKGIGPKTVACVLMFHLQKDDFPADTHLSSLLSFMLITSPNLFLFFFILKLFMKVFEIAKAVGWVPAMADRSKTYLHLNQRIPNELKFDLNCLRFTHAKACSKCTKKVGMKDFNNSCPLLQYCRDS